MTREELKEHIKSALRITTNDVGINSEVDVLISSALIDLQMSGIKIDVLDDIIVLAVTLYCKAKFGFDNPESERLYESFRTLETHLALSKEYKEQLNEV